MADSAISLLAASRSNIVKATNSTVAGAVLEEADDSVAAQVLEMVYDNKAQYPNLSPIDWIELAIGSQIDAGEPYPFGDLYAFAGAEWIATMNDLSNLPDPWPRDFVLYIAIALVQEGKATSVHDEIATIINNHSFF